MTGRLKHWFSLKGRLEREKASLKRALNGLNLEAEVKALRVELDQVEGGDIISDPVDAKYNPDSSSNENSAATGQGTQTVLEKAGLTKRLSGHTAPVQEMALAILEEFSGQWLNTSQIAALIQDRFSYKIRPATTSSAIRLLRDRGVIAKKPKSWLYTFVMVPRRTAP